MWHGHTTHRLKRTILVMDGGGTGGWAKLHSKGTLVKDRCERSGDKSFLVKYTVVGFVNVVNNILSRGKRRRTRQIYSCVPFVLFFVRPAGSFCAADSRTNEDDDDVSIPR